MAEGRLYAVVGPSGAGKDTLIEAARVACPELHVVRRVITRPESAGGEDFEGVTEAEFERRLAVGEFALWWRAHGLSYGIPRSVDDALAEGRNVVFNCSRAVIGAAAARYPGMRVLLVSATPETRALRLAARGRESAAEIRARLDRGDYRLPEGLEVTVVDNDGALEDAVAHFVVAVSS